MNKRELIDKWEESEALCSLDIIVTNTETGMSWEDKVEALGFAFEVMDNDNFKIKQDKAEIVIAGYHFGEVNIDGDFDAVELVTKHDRFTGGRVYADFYKKMWVRTEDLINRLIKVGEQLKSL